MNPPPTWAEPPPFFVAKSVGANAESAQFFRVAPAIRGLEYNSMPLKTSLKGVRQFAAAMRHFAILLSSAEDGTTRPRRRGFPTIERPHGEIFIP